MDLLATYNTKPDGDLIAKITVILKGDFATDRIFNGHDDYPSKKDFRLKFGFVNHISKVCETDKEATEWVDKEICALRKCIGHMRYAKEPKNETFVL